VVLQETFTRCPFHLRFDIYDGRLTEPTNFMFLTAFKFFKGVAAKSYCT
jgi:hypothetical protein